LEIVLIAEHFCLGRRRMHLFGRDDTLRPGWLTVGPELTSSNFDASRYRHFFDRPPAMNSVGGYTTGCTDRIELLRPKSPVPMDKRGGGGGMMMGHGGGGNMNSRPDGGGGGRGGNSWQRTGNIRDQPRGAMSGPRHMQPQQSHQKPPMMHDRERDQHSNRGVRNGMIPGGGGRMDRFPTSRQYGSQRGATSTHYGRGRERDPHISHPGVRRNF